jgi:hypothetical protein
MATFSSTLGNGAYFDYWCYASYGGGIRARTGTVMAIWNGTSTNFTDYSTPDLGLSTRDIEFSIKNPTGNAVEFISTVTSGTWTVKSGIRII